MATPRHAGSFSFSFSTLIGVLAVVAAIVFGAPHAAAAIFTVTNNGDGADATPGDGTCADGAGACTLRAAIQEANAYSTGAPHTINFAIGSGTVTITPASALPAVTRDGTYINGATQPGFAGTPIVEINGQNAGAGADGITLAGTGQYLVSVVINRFSHDGVVISGNTNRVLNCYIGTDVLGTSDLGNGRAGLAITSGSNTIGGNGASVRNVLSGNTSFGILIQGAGATNNVLQGNYLGTDASGTLAIPNGFNGVLIIDAATGNDVGYGPSGWGNLISGNGSAGVRISGAGTSSNSVQSNLIGTNASGTAALANSGGVEIGDGATNNSVGGDAALERNVLSGNTYDGVIIQGSGTSSNSVVGNYIGTNISGTSAVANGRSGVRLVNGATGNTVGGAAGERNVISGNASSGVSIEGPVTGSSTVRGNLIGLDAAGTAAVANTSYGIAVVDSAGNTIGGAVSGTGNVISGNGWDGMYISGTAATGNVLQGNRIGTDLTGSNALANRSGIVLVNTGANTIGGSGTDEPNLISGNRNHGMVLTGGTTGVQVVRNVIGLSAAGADLGNGSSGGDGVSLSNDAVTNTFSGNVISGNAGRGVHIAGSTTNGNTFTGNFIGTNAAGTAAIGNDAMGIEIWEGNSNVIGGTAAGAGNVISGNGDSGVAIRNGASGNQLLGNRIGTTAAGTAALANAASGVWISESPSNTIGGTVAGAGNVISGNVGHGISMDGAATTGNVVRGNFIGTGVGGAGNLGNGSSGIMLSSSPDNMIGGTSAGAGNTIAFNGGDGVSITGPMPCILKELSQNSIDSNGGLGIDLVGTDGVDANDAGDTDVGPNGLQNFPDLTAATIDGGSITIEGSLSTSAGTYRLEFFASPACDPSGYGEGAVYLGSTSVGVSETVASFTVTLAATVTDGYVITATATDAMGNTSEFSACVTSAVQEQAEPIPALGSAGLMALFALLGIVGVLALRPRMA